VVGIEINPEGHRYALENIKANKLKTAETYCGDVREIMPQFGIKFDRIIMPLPKTADKYLDLALAAAEKNAVIHFYDFELEVEVEKGEEKIAQACSMAGKKYEILEVVKTGQPAPHAYRYCFDFKVE
jgi:tRNA (guanine37-N1)-methyltransferase